MRRFLARFSEGGGQAVIDPGTLPHLEIYLSGQRGFTPSGNLSALTNWADQSGNGRNFTTIAGGTTNPIVLTSGVGLAAGITCISISAGNTPRSIGNNGLPVGFTQARGTTQYILANLNVANGNGLTLASWSVGAGAGPSLVLQATGFNGGPPGNAIWTSGTIPAGEAVDKFGSLGIDTLVATPQQQWALWTLEVDANGGASVWLNGALVNQINTSGTVYSLSTQMFLGGPSTGNAQFGEVALYLLYTDSHTAGQIAAVHGWIKGIYGY